jgi:hypothetical protein
MESTLTTMTVSSNCFAAQSNVIPNMYDLPLTAALQTYSTPPWRHQDPRRTPSSRTRHHEHGKQPTSPARQQGATILIQQEQARW